MVPNRDVILAIATLDGYGHGHLDVFVPGMELTIRDLFEKPRDIRDAAGKVLRTLNPWSREALQDLVEGGLHRHGLMGEFAGDKP